MYLVVFVAVIFNFFFRYDVVDVANAVVSTLNFLMIIYRCCDMLF